MNFQKHREDGNSNDRGRFRLISPGLAARLLPYLCFVLLLCGSALAQNATPTNLGPIRTTYQDDVGTAIPPAAPSAVGVCRRYYNTVTNQETYINSAGANCGPPSAFVCGNAVVPGLPYWNGTQCVVDTGATFDPINLVWNFEAIVSSGTILAPKFQTSGTGGVLELQAQTPPTSVPSGKFDVFLNSNTNQLACINTSLASCFNGILQVASGSITLPATLVSANGGCNLYTASSTGLTSSNKVWPFVTVDVTGVTGYAPGQLEIYPPYATTNTVNIKVCNPTTGNITPASLTVQWIAI